MYPLSLRVGDRGGPNLQPPIPSLCTATPSFQEKIIVDFPPPHPGCLPFYPFSPHALSSSSSPYPNLISHTPQKRLRSF